MYTSPLRTSHVFCARQLTALEVTENINGQFQVDRAMFNDKVTEP